MGFPISSPNFGREHVKDDYRQKPKPGSSLMSRGIVAQIDAALADNTRVEDWGRPVAGAGPTEPGIFLHQSRYSPQTPGTKMQYRPKQTERR